MRLKAAGGGEKRDVLRASTADGAALAITRITGARAARAAAVLIHGFGQNRHLLDLPGRSFAHYLFSAGFDCYVLELRGHGLSRVRGDPAIRHISDYAELDLPAAVARIRQSTDLPMVLVGHSMGGIACMGAPREVLASVAGVVTIASPTHFGYGARAVRLLSRVATEVIFQTSRNRPPMVLPAELIGTLLQLTRAYWDSRLPAPLRIWEPGQIEADLLRTYLAIGFEPEATGAFLDLARWARRRSFDRAPGGACVREALRSYPVPILFVAGRQDWLVPPSSIRPGYEITRAPLKGWRVYGGPEHRGRYGHVDLLLGKYAPEEVWPQVLEWMERYLSTAPPVALL